MSEFADKLIEQRIIKLASLRGIGKTICPSEVARSLESGDWRELMPKIRESSLRLLNANKISVTQSGEPVNPLKAKGPIRIAIKE